MRARGRAVPTGRACLAEGERGGCALGLVGRMAEGRLGWAALVFPFSFKFLISFLFILSFEFKSNQTTISDSNISNMCIN
jgi:hypothetical protein